MVNNNSYFFSIHNQITRNYSQYQSIFIAYIVLFISDDNLLIGTREGHLLMYNVPSVFDDSHKLELLRHSKNFNKKRINQIDVVPEYNLLIILTGIFKIILSILMS